jgi:5'-nucleotidase / UDP-sugar diphosphatase
MKANRTNALLLTLLALAFAACDPAKKAVGTPGSGKDDGIIEVTLLQINDVYEISPTPSDNTGGLARVATIRKELLAKNPNTLTLLAGDFISPSVIGTLRHEGKRIRGKQMVETLNALGLDMTVFGNHEFDYDDLADLQARLDESNFTWFGANARLKNPQPNTLSPMTQFFKNRDGARQPCPDNQVIALKDADGTTLNLGVFGVLINTGRKPWVEYLDYLETAKQQFAQLKPKSDVVLALTHLALEDDQKLAAALPEIPLVIGGHEHENHFEKVGKVVIAKADANAKTVYVHTLRYDRNAKTCTVKSELRRVNGDIADDPATAAVVAKWEKIKNESLASSGFSPSAVVTQLREPLDCREITIRNKQAPAGAMITGTMLNAVGNDRLDCALFNSGSIRVDDILTGTLTELDVVRMLPFGGAIADVQMRGSLLRRTLDTGLSNKGNGGFLQHGRISQNAAGQWLVSGAVLDDKRNYWVTLPEFLLSGNEQNMGFLKASASADGKGTNNPDILTINRPDPKDKNDKRNDIRLVLIAGLRK